MILQGFQKNHISLDFLMYSLKVHKKEYKKGPRRSIIKWVQQARTSVVISYAFLIACKCIISCFYCTLLCFTVSRNFKKGKLCTEEGGVVEPRINPPPIKKLGGIPELYPLLPLLLFDNVLYGLQLSLHCFNLVLPTVVLPNTLTFLYLLPFLQKISLSNHFR